MFVVDKVNSVRCARENTPATLPIALCGVWSGRGSEVCGVGGSGCGSEVCGVGGSVWSVWSGRVCVCGVCVYYIP